jgi:hypothetical protein
MSDETSRQALSKCLALTRASGNPALLVARSHGSVCQGLSLFGMAGSSCERATEQCGQRQKERESFGDGHDEYLDLSNE